LGQQKEWHNWARCQTPIEEEYEKIRNLWVLGEGGAADIEVLFVGGFKYVKLLIRPLEKP